MNRHSCSIITIKCCVCIDFSAFKVKLHNFISCRPCQFVLETLNFSILFAIILIFVVYKVFFFFLLFLLFLVVAISITFISKLCQFACKQINKQIGDLLDIKYNKKKETYERTDSQKDEWLFVCLFVEKKTCVFLNKGVLILFKY